MNEKNCMLITPNSGSLLGSSMCFFYPSARATTLAMGPQNTEEPLGLPIILYQRCAFTCSFSFKTHTNVYQFNPTHQPTNLLICFYLTNIPSMHTYFIQIIQIRLCNLTTQLVAYIKWK